VTSIGQKAFYQLIRDQTFFAKFEDLSSQRDFREPFQEFQGCPSLLAEPDLPEVDFSYAKIYLGLELCLRRK